MNINEYVYCFQHKIDMRYNCTPSFIVALKYGLIFSHLGIGLVLSISDLGWHKIEFSDLSRARPDPLKTLVPVIQILLKDCRIYKSVCSFKK